MNTLYRLLAVLLFFIMPLSTMFAQENWGPSDDLCYVSGCDYFIANPAFYDSSIFCYEFSGFEYIPYWLFAYPLPGYADWDTISGDMINLDSINYTSPFRTFAGDKLYFSSDLPGGFGGYDIWVSEREGDNWGIPENLGPNINSEFHDLGPSLPLTEDEIYFFRNELEHIYVDDYYHGTIFSSENINGEWEEAEELPSIINATGHIVEPSISSDGLKLYFTGFYPELSPHFFAYVSYRENDSWAFPQLLNSNINTIYNGPPWYEDDGTVYSVAVDSSGTSLLFYYHYCPEGFMYGLLKISHLTVDIDETEPIPQNIELMAYPNPFNARTIINFTLAEQSPVELSVYDIAGRLVETLRRGTLPPGPYRLTWNARNLPSGIYFARLVIQENSSITKLTLIK